MGVCDTEDDGEEDLATPDQKLTSTADAQLAVDNLGKFFCQCEGADSAIASIQNLESLLISGVINRHKQLKIIDFFK